MGLFSATGAFFSGEFSKAADLLFIPESTIDEGNDVDKRIAAFNASVPADKQIPSKTFQQVVDEADPSGAFVEGAKEGLTNIVDGVKDTTGTGLVATISALRYVIITAIILFAVYLFVKKKL